MWELITVQVHARTRAGATTAVEWAKAYADIPGNKLADELAKAAAKAANIPAWLLNTSLSPVTRHNLLLSGVNLLLPPLKMLKQSRTLHAANLRNHIVRHHPLLEEHLPVVLWQRLGRPPNASESAAEKQSH